MTEKRYHPDSVMRFRQASTIAAPVIGLAAGQGSPGPRSGNNRKRYPRTESLPPPRGPCDEPASACPTHARIPFAERRRPTRTLCSREPPAMGAAIVSLSPAQAEKEIWLPGSVCDHPEWLRFMEYWLLFGKLSDVRFIGHCVIERIGCFA